MTDEEFNSILTSLNKYLQMEKKFIVNPMREAEFRSALSKANELFPKAKIEVHDDPLEMGAMILHIEDYSLDVCKGNQNDMFIEIVRDADNFEIYATPDGNVCLAAVYQDVLVRI